MPSDKARKARSARVEEQGADTVVADEAARVVAVPVLDAPVLAAAAFDAEVLSRFLSELARRVRANPDLARELGAALVASGLLGSVPGGQGGAGPAGAAEAAAGAATPRARRATTRSLSRSTGARGGDEASLPDPFALLRAGGVEAVREGLSQYDSYELQRIIRAHRLDPARISARWTARERLLGLIVDQVRARANHGRAFERV